jgi:hypothetical protein
MANVFTWIKVGMHRTEAEQFVSDLLRASRCHKTDQMLRDRMEILGRKIERALIDTLRAPRRKKSPS